MFQIKFHLKLAALAVCAVAFVCLAQQAEAKSKYTITAVSAWPKQTYMVGNFMWFVNHANEMAAKQYPGQLEIEYIGGPKAIPLLEQIDAMRSGFVDMVFTAASYYAQAVPLMDGMSMSDYMPWEERNKGVNDFLQPFHKNSINAYFFSRMGSGMNYQIYSTKPIDTFQDLKGLRLRASPSVIPFAKAANAIAKVIPPPAIYKSIESGNLDGVLWPQSAIVDWKWEKVVKYMVEPVTNYTACDISLMNWDTWNGLPKHLQTLLIKAVTDAEHQLIRRAQNFITEKYAYLKESGVKVSKLPEADAERMLKTCREVLWADLMKIDPDNAKRLRDMITK